jgi:hypothetical protein
VVRVRKVSFSVIRPVNLGILHRDCELSARAEPRSKMRLTVYLLFILLFVFGMYTLPICVNNFRGTRGSGTSKPYLYVLGILFSVVLIVLAATGVFLVLFGRLRW